MVDLAPRPLFQAIRSGARNSRPLTALALGVVIGSVGALAGVLIVLLDPILAFGVVLGTLAALYILTNITAALYGVVAMLALLPFGTLPVRIAFTPTLLDGALGAFLLVYILDWATSARREAPRLTPPHALIALYAGWLVVSFVLGLRHAPVTSTIARQFAETILSIGMAFVLVDLLRDAKTLRRLLAVVLLLAGAQALIALGLYAMNDATAERTLIRLARLGYPDGGVIRYIEDNPALSERAIGTFVDPNVLGGFLAITATLAAAQVFARRPVLPRWLVLVIFGALGAALFLTYSRAAMLAFGGGLLLIAVTRGYRLYLAGMLVGGLLLFALPQTQGYVERLIDAFTAGDLATQMRIGEYTDSFRLITRYPITGVGFTGSPDRDLYTDVASMYLIMANQIGLVGVGLFALAMLGIFGYGWRAWRRSAHAEPSLRALHLGAHAALLTVLLNATTDHYFFRLDFHASITLLWLVIALALTSSRLALTDESTVAKAERIL